jgi:hypothetical protein
MAGLEQLKQELEKRRLPQPKPPGQDVRWRPKRYKRDFVSRVEETKHLIMLLTDHRLAQSKEIILAD